eukprot:2996881-Prymnesium_polylepis.1
MGFDSSSTVTLRRCSRVYAIQSGCILVTPSSLCSIQPVSMTQSVLTISPINMGGQCDTDSKVYIFVATGERAVIDFNSRSAAAVYPLTRVLTSIGYLNLVASPSPPFTPPLPSYPFGHPMSPPPHPIAPPLISLPIAPPSTPTNHVVPPGSPYVRSDSTNCTVDSFEPRCICAVNMKKETYGGQTFFTLSLHWFIAEINIQFSRSDVDVWAHSPTHDNEQYAQVASSGEFFMGLGGTDKEAWPPDWPLVSFTAPNVTTNEEAISIIDVSSSQMSSGDELPRTFAADDNANQ